MLMRYRQVLKLITGASICACMAGCASPLREATEQFRQGAYPAALITLEEKGPDIANRDRLLLHLNKGLVLHQLGRFEESNQELLTAANVIEELSRASISEQASTLAINDWLASYRGEYAEQLWVHSYLMMNFLLLNKPESAAVEARRALKVFDSQPDSLKEAFFTRALVATSFENAGHINDAYLEYKLLAENSVDNSNISDKLYSQALQLGFTKDAEQYRAELFDEQEQPLKQNDNNGELIVFLSRGDIPYKVSSDVYFPPDIRLSWPEYGNSYQHLDNVDVFNDSGLIGYQEIESDFASLARTSLYNRGKGIALKQALRIGAKHAIVDQVESENAVAGGVLQIAMFILEQADTRAWDSLPSKISMLRIPLSAGSHTIRLSANNHELMVFPEVNIPVGKTVFRHFRVESYVGETEPQRETRHKPVTVEYHIEKEL